MFLNQILYKTASAGTAIKCLFPPKDNYHIALQKITYHAGSTAHQARILDCVSYGTRTGVLTNASSIVLTTMANRYSTSPSALYLVTCSTTYTNVTLHTVTVNAYDVTTKTITMNDTISVPANSLYFLMRDPSDVANYTSNRRTGGTIYLPASQTTNFENTNGLLVDASRLGDPLLIEVDNVTNAGILSLCAALYYH